MFTQEINSQLCQDTSCVVTYFKKTIHIYIYIYTHTHNGDGISKKNYMHSYTCFTQSCTACGPGSVVGIATGYGLDGPGIETRWGARFSAPFQTGPGAHPASCKIGTGSFPGVKSGRSATLTPHPLLVSWSWKTHYEPYGLYRASVPVQGCTVPLPLHLHLYQIYLIISVYLCWLKSRSNNYNTQ